MPAWLSSPLLPGAWVLGLGIALLLVLRRAFDPLPPRVAAVFGAVVALFLGAVLFGGSVLLPLDSLRGRAPFQAVPAVEPPANPLQGDLLQLVAPALVQVRAAYARGEWPLWNDKVGAGMPLLANPQSQALQPLAWLGLALPVPAAAGVIAALRLLGAFVFLFLFLRRLALGEVAALGGALAWGLGGFVQLWLGWPLANLAVWLPLVLYALALLDDREARRDELLLTAALAGLALCGHPEGIAYALIVAIAFAAARTLARAPGRRRAFAARLARAGILAAALVAPAWWPAAELLPHSIRAEAMRRPGDDVTVAAMSALPGHDATAAARFPPAVRRLVPAIAPNAFGNGRYDDPSGVTYWGWSNTNEDSSGFAGTLVGLLALLACVPGATRRPQEPLFLGLAVAGVLGLALPPDWLGALPGAGQRLVGILGFLLTIVAACELDRWRRGLERRRALLAVALVLAAALVWATAAHAHPTHPEALAIVRVGTLKLQLKVLAVAVAVLLLSRRSRWAISGLLLAMVWESYVLWKPANPPSPGRLATVATPATEFLRGRLGTQRMVALGRAFPANEPAFFGLADARCYDPAQPAAFDRLVAPLLATPRGNVPELVGTDSRDSGLLDLLGVRYVLTGRGGTEPAVPADWRRAFEDDAAAIYERPGALPRFFLPGAARLATDSALPAAAAIESTVDRLPVGLSTWTAAGPAARSSLGQRSPEFWRLGVRLAETRLLASGEYQDGNWHVLADRRTLSPVQANGPFIGAWLPGGTTSVEVLYRPRTFLFGALLAALALAVACSIAAEPTPERRGLRR